MMFPQRTYQTKKWRNEGYLQTTINRDASNIANDKGQAMADLAEDDVFARQHGNRTVDATSAHL